jgi:PKD repeat protein
MPPQITCPHCGNTINLENRREVDFEKIMYALDKSPKTFTELLAITSLPRKTLSIRLKELCSSGSIIKDGGYHLNSLTKPTNKILGKRIGNGKMNGTMLHIGKNVQWIPAALIVCLVLVAFGSAAMLSPPPPAPKSPNAGFSYSPISSIFVGSALTFDASISNDPDGHITGYRWDFGDGMIDSGVIVSHAYSSEGYFTVTLKVTDNQGLGASREMTVYVSSVPPPTIKFVISPDPSYGWENKWIVGKSLTFDASAFNVANGYSPSYAWDFGDGATGLGTTVSHSYQKPGTYSVALTFSDKSVEQQVTILEKPTTTIYVDPIPTEYQSGDIITLNIMVSDVTALRAWQAGMTFNPVVLQCIPANAPDNAQGDVTTTAFIEGDFLKNGGSTWWFPGTLSNDAGIITFHGCNLYGAATPVTGSGVLATVKFTVIGEGAFNIHLTDVTLIGQDAMTEIPVYVAT